ncbi:helix-turn-helix domain-containing protein [Xenorhabdus bovienii]|uniref:Helix-turn-helix domain-containing protein n=1 Tax=Xenorhabdus bovienii TaxID=40576 RepID=A0AAJ1N187_XENBV|nr:LexA family transcriptional regulator [Xenorhabdus bovienii]MDE1480639.1 helix-turn-helix domain-containing protein [Xenorhabdus bovienii]MDE1488921.1 helix-turn-helix domain-containing protein [Xenorhabdus bovienii]MDE1493020.1 helix-turn-helix domain-containing protein [Xenorhabdus bovienii]MDE9512354.1 helix-turn-helix domain-containing protein [Xenorhabdus bovienii]MDE9523993.1 helix-turn-helix domain-containing protein [Xenorhabdus bovienii]
MNDFAKRLIESRKNSSLTQQDLADKAKVTRVAISKAEQGLTKTFNADTLFKIAAALKVDPFWLQTGKELQLKRPELNESTEHIAANNVDLSQENICPARQPEYRYKYPKINWVQAGAFARSGDDYSMFDIENWHESIKCAGERGYWLDVKGDSMTSPSGITFPEGMSILVNPEKDPYPGCYVIAEVKDSNEVTFKKYVVDIGREYLKPLNPIYHMIQMDGSIRIIGVVVDARWDIF